jgi:putative zinc finger/helix-turn-helix YgiT family protein
MKNCINCNSELIHLTNQTLVANFKTANGIKKLNLKKLSFSKCNKCGEIFFDSKDSKIYDEQLIKALEENRKQKGLLTAKEIKELREERNLTQEELEKLLRVSPKNVARWETYKSDQSKTADLLLRMLKDNPVCFELISKYSA